MNCSPHYYLYPVYKEGGGGGGIHSIRHIGWNSDNDLTKLSVLYTVDPINGTLHKIFVSTISDLLLCTQRNHHTINYWSSFTDTD